MFKGKTARIDELAKQYSEKIDELERIFDKKTNVYIDYANVKPWAKKLGWHVEPKRLKQFLDSFDTVEVVNFYNDSLPKSGWDMVVNAKSQTNYVFEVKNTQNKGEIIVNTAADGKKTAITMAVGPR